MKEIGFRQGEILFIKAEINEEQSEAICRLGSKRTDNVIREGEATGHKHEVVGVDSVVLYETQNQAWGCSSFWDNTKNYRVDHPVGDMFLLADKPVSIIHPEHGELKLDKGNYIVRIQREYDEAEKYRYIAD